MPPLLADFSHARACKPFCEKYLTLPTAKANVDRLLKMDEEQKKEQEKDHGQR